MLGSLLDPIVPPGSFHACLAGLSADRPKQLLSTEEHVAAFVELSSFA
jgi:hypothetical protein